VSYVRSKYFQENSKTNFGKQAHSLIPTHEDKKNWMM